MGVNIGDCTLEGRKMDVNWTSERKRLAENEKKPIYEENFESKFFLKLNFFQPKSNLDLPVTCMKPKADVDL